MNNKNYLISVTGPTAVGKTNLSIEIAKNFNSEIISFDSRQFYKEMTIGTAVPDVEQLASVKHHFIQNKSIHDKYTVKDFSNESKNLIEKLFRKNNIIVLVGGSFLFLESIIYGLDEIPNIPKSVREDLNNLYLKKGINFLSNILKEKDIKYYSQIDNKNHRRVIRALEVIEHTGEKFSSFLNNNKKEMYNHIQIALDCNRNVLYERINSRVDLMIKNGLILVDTKYEFGYDNFGNIVLIDEIHTPDSSRYFYKDTYEELQLSGKKQRQLSKEFFREWLMKNNFQGLEGQTIPNIDSEVVKMVSSRYIELYEKLLGKKFLVPKVQNINERISSNLKDFI